MKKLLICASVVFLAATSLPSTQAAFHFFDIQEVFSNSDGTVQYIELFTTFGGQQFLADHHITFEINATAIQTYNFTTNLPGDTANKSFILGTANLTALYGVTPDYIIPANFLAAGANNFIDFEDETDKVSLASLPTDGVQSLNGMIGDANTNPAAVSINSQGTPTNFAGQSATIPEPGSALLLLAGSAALLRRRSRV